MVKRIILALLMIGMLAACEEIDPTNEDITQEAATESPGDDVVPIRYVKTIKSFYESDCYEQISIDSATITYDGKNRIHISHKIHHYDKKNCIDCFGDPDIDCNGLQEETSFRR